VISRHRCRPSFLLLFLTSLAPCLADTITLDDGSRLVGKVVAIRKGKVSLKTSFAGTLSLPLAKVVTMRTDAPLRVALQESGEAEGQVSLRAGQVELQTPEGPVRAPVAGLVAAGPAGKPLPSDPPPKPKRNWRYEVSGQYRGKSGNTDSTRLGLGAKAIWKKGGDQLKLYANWNQTEQSDRVTEDEAAAGFDLERQLTGRHSWYTRLELERDEIEQLALRATLAAGYGYHLIKNENRKLRLRSGLLYRRESFDYDRGDNDAIGIELGAKHTWKVAKWGNMVNDVTYSPTLSDWADYRVVHESSLDVPLAKSQIWKLRLGLSHEYNSLSAPGTEDLDTTYFVKLVFNWR
jgi:putative salt-induced outer membrane protein YdiY